MFRCPECFSKLDYYSRGDYLCTNPECGKSFHEYELDSTIEPKENDYEAE